MHRKNFTISLSLLEDKTGASQKTVMILYARGDTHLAKTRHFFTRFLGSNKSSACLQRHLSNQVLPSLLNQIHDRCCLFTCH